MTKYKLNLETLLYEEEVQAGYVHHLKVWLTVVLAVLVVCFYFWIFTSVLHFDPPKTAHLKRIHAKWESRLDVMNRKLDIYEETLTGIEQRDDKVYRSIYGLNPISSELKFSGIGGPGRYADYEGFDRNFDLYRTSLRMDRLIKRAYVTSKSLSELNTMAQQAGDMISCVPAVAPLYNGGKGYRLSSRFGYRIDPVYGGGENHGGQDFAAEKGTPVYVTGDGVVVVVNLNPRKGYGNEIVVNHGYGYMTRYAHLNTVDVAVGLKVQRGEKIGTVGSTGKSTGPHLHYEVIYRGRRVNPVNYMDTGLPAEEYKAMIDSRARESVIGRRTAVSDLLKKREE